MERLGGGENEKQPLETPFKDQGTLSYWKALSISKYETREYSCLEVLNISNLVHKYSFVDSHTDTTLLIYTPMYITFSLNNEQTPISKFPHENIQYAKLYMPLTKCFVVNLRIKNA